MNLYKYMGGVDMADALRRVHSCMRKTKNKWYMRLFWFLLDTCVVNACILRKKSPNHPRSISQLNFVVQLAQELIEQNDSQKTVGKGPVVPISDARYTKHVPFKFPSARVCKVRLSHKQQSVLYLGV